MIDLLQREFVQNAFLAGTIVAIVSAVIGYFVVLRTQAFASDSLSHIGFAGATGGPLFGISSLLGMFILTLLSALGIGALGERIRGRDVETGMVLAFVLGLGVLFTSLYASGQNATATVSALFGSILSVSHEAVIITLISGIVVLFVITFLFRPLLFASIDPEVAEARGVPVRLLSILFLLLLAITVATAIQVVGALLVFALLIAPAASAAQWTRRPLITITLSTILSLVFTWSGLILAFDLGVNVSESGLNLVFNAPGQHLPVSFYVSALAALSYFLSLLLSRLHAPRRYRPQSYPSCKISHDSSRR